MRTSSCVCVVLVGALFWAIAPAQAAHGGGVRNARITGKVLRCGGPARGPKRCFAANRAVVSVFDSRDQLVARERVADAHFSFRVRRGHYTLSATEPGHATVSRCVTAKAHQTIHTKLRFALH